MRDTSDRLSAPHVNDHDKGGQPPLGSVDLCPEILDEIRNARHANNALRRSEVHDLILQKIKKIQAMKNKCNHHQGINAKTERLLLSMCKIKFRRSQEKTSAHAREENDCRNAISFAVGICSGSKGKSDLDVFSFDSTSLEVVRNGSSHEELVAVVDDLEESENHGSISSTSSRNLPYSIKGHFLSCRSGHIAPLCIIIVDSSLDEGLFKVHPVPGLSVCGSPSDSGWMIFSPT